ncbi:hypothetical protein A2685_02930 [Candidatus Woesebacteria bacterium RIFCSPHIGHO2_01_FULL_37_10]|uniref:Uncharacterized protein n=1 Tax=Candidatus Woesebacteria bacterium RIFCSPHIGHO2_01_FULL_37_10 TaxID=1802489 RepID=A0A1F7XSY2_9BACT|nr:MAG: hypothetical protein A2685_02930 [Candidatus Woesebacteria bacterium RIFCSPHIGHO2_01_FULL_37_10]
MSEGKSEKIKELEKKLIKYKEKLAQKKLGYGEVGRTGSGDSYSDQLRDDTNALEGIIQSIKEEIISLTKNDK